MTLARARSAFSLALAALACSVETLPLDTPAPPPPEPVAWPGPLDVLFVIDDAGTQSEAIEARLVASIPEHGDDVRVGAISGSVGVNRQAQTGSFVYLFAAEDPFNLIALDAASCTSLDFEPGCVRDTVLLGSCGGSQSALEAVSIALELECNRSFFREEAMLLVVIASDDDEQTEFMPAIDALFAKKGGLERVRVLVIAGAVDGRASSCRIPENASCGSLCERRPAEGSHSPCETAQDCSSGEYCDWREQHCENIALQYFAFCDRCSYYNQPDCCMSEASTRLVEFANALGDRARVQSVCADRFDLRLW